MQHYEYIKSEECMKDFNLQELAELKPQRIIFSNQNDKSYGYRRVEIHETFVSGKRCYQISRYTEKQVFQENFPYEKLSQHIEEIFPEKLCQINCFTDTEEISLKMTKKGKLLSQRKKASCIKDGRLRNDENSRIQLSQPTVHNRQKNYIIKEGTVVPPLVDMGVFTKEGRVVKSMYDKFKQINRFVEIVDDIISRHNRNEIYIIDFGCGKSYLTFILYYYLVEIRKIRAHITGLDLKADVIEKCNAAAEKYGYDGLQFELGDINGYTSDTPVDMVVTLHACDTATDYALYNAVAWNARYILSVPCCQHELNKTMKCDELAPLMNYGILKERMAAIATDAIRGNMLTYRGYKTQIMEFVDIDNSPKNLLIRAVKSNVPAEKRERAYAEVEKMCSSMESYPTIYKLLACE
jgi:SAM-dependent methyltransferase